MDFEARYRNKADVVNRYLSGLFPEVSAIPEPLYSAMKYSLLSGGKRLRPVLMIAASEMFNPVATEVMQLAAAVEMIHTYSLIHDDLPAMDDDNLRRGRPTNHMIYGEGMAILAGDALLNLAYETMLEATIKAGNVKAFLRASTIVARAAGATGMVGGQCMDLSGEGGNATERDLSQMHKLKTSKLIEAAILAGAILGGAGEEAQNLLGVYGESVGLAFQITDDLLDVLGDSKVLGKPVGSDADKEKLTFPKVYGIEKSRELAAASTQKALDALDPLGEKAEFLREFAKFVLNRQS